MPELNSDENSLVEVDQSVPSVGAMFYRARKSRGFSAEFVASQLYMTRESILALERDEYKKVGSDVFVRGYLKNYAKLLGLDDDVVMEAYRQTHTDVSTRHIVRKPLSMQKRHSGQPIWWLVIVVVAIIAGCWSLWGNNVSQKAGKLDTIKLETASGSTVVKSLLGDEKTAPENSVLGGGVAADKVIPAPSDVVDHLLEPSIPAVEESNRLALDTNRLELTFTQECWLEIRDVNGKVLVSGIKQAGEKIEVFGVPPFKLNIGVAKAVSLRYMNRNIEVVPRTGGKAAKLTVG